MSGAIEGTEMATFAKILLGLWMAAMLTYVFLILPPAAMFASPELARIVALHLPNAYVACIAAFMAGLYGWRYLARGRKPLDDARSASAAALAALFCLLTTVTGSVFARVQWGAFWNWDPRETAVTMLLLVYAAYFVLRASVEDPEKRAAVSAVYILFASVLTPMLGYVIPKMMMSLHPTNVHFDAPYRIGIYGTALGLLGILFWLQNITVRFERVRLEVAADSEDF
jgi:heme exporter protein C